VDAGGDPYGLGVADPGRADAVHHRQRRPPDPDGDRRRRRPIALSIFGNEDFQTETLLATEAGYRVRPVDPLSLDLALFMNHYDRIRTGSIGAPFLETTPPPLHAVIPVNLDNRQHGQTPRRGAGGETCRPRRGGCSR